MKKIFSLVIIVVITVLTVNAQEKKIKFNKGTLKICSTKSFTIEGYDGNEVIVKSLHEKANQISQIRFSTSAKNKPNVGKVFHTQKGLVKFDSVFVTGQKSVYFARTDQGKKEGLRKLGKNNENKDLGIYFTIEQNDGELIFKDDNSGQFVMLSNERYLIKIPNSIKLNWDTSNCKKTPSSHAIFYTNKASSLSNFEGELELTTSLNNFELTDVTGPVSINSIGGNVTVFFDKKLPLKLYSIYTNNGFIDISMPSNSDVHIEASGSAIYSDLAFNMISEKEINNQQKMELKLKRGKTKMMLEAGYGTIYLRKKK